MKLKSLKLLLILLFAGYVNGALVNAPVNIPSISPTMSDVGLDILKNFSISISTNAKITITGISVPEIYGVKVGTISVNASSNIEILKNHNKPIVEVKEFIWNKNIPNNVRITKIIENYRIGNFMSKEIEIYEPIQKEQKFNIWHIIIAELIIALIIVIIVKRKGGV